MPNEASVKQVKTLLLDVLRHDPDSIGLALDEEGFVTISDFLYCANLSHPLQITEETLLKILKKGEGSLFDVDGDKVRALKGHTTEQFSYPEAKPPENLYYIIRGIDRDRVEEYGLEALKDKWIPLELSKSEAIAQKGRRRIKKPILLKIRAQDAWNSGVSFYIFCNQWYIQNVDAAFVDME